MYPLNMIVMPDCVSFQALMLKQEQEDLLVEQRKLEQAVRVFFTIPYHTIPYHILYLNTS